MSSNLSGIFTCTLYAFAPNYYHYCGPDANKTISQYLKQKASDPDLFCYLKKFSVLYPYLKQIAHSNGISDPFDIRVVEAYWIGNSLLENVKEKELIDQLLISQNLKSKISLPKLKWIINTIPRGAKLHHSFHVFSIFTRTGHLVVDHTVHSMNECRIGWGRIENISKSKHPFPNLQVKTQKLNYSKGRLYFINDIIRNISIPNHYISYKFKVGDLVTYHWGYACQKITQTQMVQLRSYTFYNLKLANSIL